jgi:hypothetical protein
VLPPDDVPHSTQPSCYASDASRGLLGLQPLSTTDMPTTRTRAMNCVWNGSTASPLVFTEVRFVLVADTKKIPLNPRSHGALETATRPYYSTELAFTQRPCMPQQG